MTALLYGGAAVGAAWLTARFLLPWAAPFLVALALAALLEGPVRFLIRHGWPRSAAAGLLSILLLGLLLWAAGALAGRGIAAVTGFARQTPALMNSLGQGLERMEQRMLTVIDQSPEGVSDYLRTAMEAVGDAIYDLPALLSQGALDLLGRAAQSSGDVLLFAVTAGIGTYFLSASFPQTLAFLRAQLPDSWVQRAAEMGPDLKGSFGALLRAQLILMTMTFFELLLAFLLLRIPRAAGIAALTALVDALPVFGTGTVLLPWAAYCLLLEDLGRGVGLIICWAMVNLVRTSAQAKLLGDQIGLDPLASLIAIYVGWRVWSVWGMLVFPVLLVTLRQLNDKGVLHLWKSA
ncbi:MAG: AI-2E family transporter [Oscillospiraceae bacterium]|nr:AI-2E family transporter [Oscillospiraceae bacterium]